MSNGDMPAIPLTKMPMYPEHNGLTKRELFAAMAMQGMAEQYGTCDLESIKHCARKSVDYADALLAALGGDDE